MTSILYTGLRAPSDPFVTHCPLIKIVPKDFEVGVDFFKFTHLLFTSKTAIDLSLEKIPKEKFPKKIITVGEKSKALLHIQNASIISPKEECQEGLIQLFDEMDLRDAFLFWPRSSKSRPLLSNYFKERGIHVKECVLYETMTNIPTPLPDLNLFEEVYFTSPSTVDAFFEIFEKVPTSLKFQCIGPITKNHLAKKFELQA